MKYRADIDGLRAFAVLSVVTFHAFPTRLQGGFIGVDIFFVISGYLITHILLEELRRESFSLTNFYARRVRRIFPALISVTLIALLLGWFTLLNDEYIQLNKHIASGFAFVINFVLVNESGYFDNIAVTKPMLHLWSLAVEEQFYICWPLILWAAWKQKLNTFIITITLILLSFIFNIRLISTNPVGAFFWPTGRFWELLCGSLLAWLFFNKPEILSKIGFTVDRYLARILCSEKRLHIGNTFADFISLSGFFLLLYGVLKIPEGATFPGKFALVPVLGSMLVITAGPSALFNRYFLMNKVVIWFGLISYPLYLWHWPIFSFLRILKGDTPHRDTILFGLSISIVLAWLTYKFIEQPIRKNFKNPFIVFTRFLPLAVLIAIFSFLIFQKVLTNDPVKHTWIDRNETIANCNNYFPNWNKENDNKCEFQKVKDNTIALIGDSHAGHLFLGIAEYIDKTSSVDGVVLFPASCQTPLMNISSAFTVKENPKIDRMRKNGYRYINKGYDYIINSNSIKTVIMAHTPYCDPKIKDIINPTISSYEKILTMGFNRTLNALSSSGKKVVIVLDNPALKTDPSSCSPRKINFWDSEECVTSEAEHREHELIKTYNRIASHVAQKFDDVTVVDLASYFCSNGSCKAIINNKLLYSDRNHLSLEGSRFVAPYILNKLDLQKNMPMK